MGTLNQYAARIASLVNQPDNHELKERIKDMIKTGFANRIRQSVEKHGIDDILKLTYEAKIQDVDKIAEHETINKIATPIRIISDAPFMSVLLDGTTICRYENSRFGARTRQVNLSSGRPTHFPTGSSVSYFVENGKIHIIAPLKYTDNNNKPIEHYLQITSIFENPDEILGEINNSDGQDIELPFPNDMLENIIYEILKTEFNMYPKDIDIKVNSDTQTIGAKQSKE